MPMFNVVSNVKLENPLDFAKSLSKFGSEITKVPEAFIVSRYSYEPYLIFAGSEEPAFIVTVAVLATEKETNEKLIQDLAPFIAEKLGVDGGRSFIMITGAGADNVAKGGVTIANIMKAMATAE